MSETSSVKTLGTERDRTLMQRCINLARQAAGRTSPNPMVGCVIVQESQTGEPEIVGEGFHPQAGQPHAEVFALRAAGDRTQGATAYVSLEPCNHYGRTPPCSEALIAAGIKKVVVGMVDPDSRVAGGGIQRLRDAGIEVLVGVEEAACQKLNEAFIHRVRHQRPFGILKYAMTLDGKIAASTGHSAWVTGAAARQEVHRLRSICDAVIVGGNTLRKDNPLLTSHGICDRNPLRVVMSRRLDLPLDAKLWDVDIAPTLVATEMGANPELKAKLCDRGVEVLEFDRLTPDDLMANLCQHGLNSVLWECGGVLAAEAIRSGSVQKIWAFIAPKLIGGQRAPSPVGEMGLQKMTDALPLSQLTCRTVGDDYLIEGYLVDSNNQQA
ncbi:MAG: bifunctional diaminohydroxyphosphoribosylaminopyrimidine deaminase/5-amino-6-(5-phosphoribosylamino)uracil reductase RibD [Thainema sp.]